MVFTTDWLLFQFHRYFHRGVAHQLQIPETIIIFHDRDWVQAKSISFEIPLVSNANKLREYTNNMHNLRRPHNLT